MDRRLMLLKYFLLVCAYFPIGAVIVYYAKKFLYRSFLKANLKTNFKNEPLTEFHRKDIEQSAEMVATVYFGFGGFFIYMTLLSIFTTK